MTNEQMKPNRFGKWAGARKLYARIMETFDAGGIVTIATYTRCTHYHPKHADMFRCGKDGVYVQRGKRFDCISMGESALCGIRFTT